MNKVRISFSLVALLIPAFNFGQAPLTGRVIDEDTKKPVSDAVVTMEGTTVQAKSNVLGYFRLEVDSTKELTVVREGYELLKFKVLGTKAFQIKLTRDVAPAYQGGIGNFYSLIFRNLKYPLEARKNDVEGSVYVSFEIDSLRGMENIALVRDIGGGCGDEVIRVLKLTSGQWIPKAKRATVIFPVVFNFFNMKGKRDLEVIDLPKGKVLQTTWVQAGPYPGTK